MTLVRAVVLLSWCVGPSLAGASPPTVAGAWIRATPPGARTAAAYLTITSPETADRLIGAATAAAGAVEIHTHVAETGVQRMVRLEELALPAGESVQLEPGGLHLMLVDIVGPLVPGTNVPLVLRFRTAGPVEIQVPVVDARGAGPTHAH